MKYEIHVALRNQSPKTTNYFLNKGYSNNQFTAHYNVEIAEFRGTLNFQEEPGEEVWNEIRNVILKDVDIKGTVEQESIRPSHVKSFSTKKAKGVAFGSFPLLPMQSVQEEEYKFCDIHISLTKDTTNNQLIKELNRLDWPYVERDKKRIYTITCESEESGNLAFKALYSLFNKIPCNGKIVMEYTDKNLRIPSTFPVLPIVRDGDMRNWVHEIHKLLE